MENKESCNYKDCKETELYIFIDREKDEVKVYGLCDYHWEIETLKKKQKKLLGDKNE